MLSSSDTGATPATHVKFLNIVSTKRSGHHAFIEWIEDGTARQTQFINNAVVGPGLLARLPGLASTSGDIILMNYEGVTVAGVSKVIAAQAATGAAVENVLFIRDPLNACASLLHRKSLQHLELVMVLRQLFALRSWLKHYQNRQFEGDLVFYNRWLQDRRYKDSVAARLSINSGSVPDQITSFGGGSSFQDLATGGESAAPHLLNRWRSYADDRLFRSLVTHPYFYDVFLAELSGAISDSAGENDADEERASFLESTRRKRKRNPLVDRIIDRLSEHQAAFERIEALPPGLRKRLLITKAHIGALLAQPSGSLAISNS